MLKCASPIDHCWKFIHQWPPDHANSPLKCTLHILKPYTYKPGPKASKSMLKNIPFSNEELNPLWLALCCGLIWQKSAYFARSNCGILQDTLWKSPDFEPDISFLAFDHEGTAAQSSKVHVDTNFIIIPKDPYCHKTRCQTHSTVMGGAYEEQACNSDTAQANWKAGLIRRHAQHAGATEAAKWWLVLNIPKKVSSKACTNIAWLTHPLRQI